MKNTKKIIALLLALVLVLAACGGNNNDADKPADENGTEENETTEPNNENEENTEDEGNADSGEAKKIAVLLYDATDPYIGTVRKAMEEIDANDDSITLEFHDGQNDAAAQTNQLDNIISQGVDGILVNIVEITGAPTFIEKLEDSGIPYLFFNRDMTESFEGTDKTIFIGTNAPEAGGMQGEMFVGYAKANDKWDRNGDGVVQYAILHGGLDNAEAKARSEYSVKTVEEAGFKVEELANQVAEWNTAKAKEATDAWLQSFPNDLDVIFANNDGMALGAVEALKQAGIDDIPVYGVDAIQEALVSVENGEM